MKESGEKGGTADINIGIGELFESEFGFSTPFAFESVAVSGTLLSFDTVSPLGRVMYSSLFTTPQPAAFESLSVETAADGRSFDLRLRLLFSDDYVPELALVAERSTADWVPIPEPAPWLLGLVGIGLARWGRSSGAA